MEKKKSKLLLLIIILMKKFLQKLRNYKPSDLKVANVTPVFKKNSKTSKDNYRHISILPNISTIYKRCHYNKTQTYFN